ncbi:MAG: ABC transporter permease [Phycisphaerae bacterium]
MRNVPTMVQRELGAYFLSPIAYAMNVVFLLSAGAVFALGSFQQGAEASLRGLLSSPILFILLGVLSMLTMRLISEELRSGTIETLMTVPITETDIVLGKFLGAVVFYLVLLGTMLLYPIIMAFFGRVDFSLLICQYIGLILIGGLYIAVGLFFSAWTRHQLIAGLLSIVALAVMTFAASLIAQYVEGWPRAVLQHLAIYSHFGDFVRGLIDVNHVVFFVTTTAFFLFLSVKALEMRRWR